MRKELSDRLYEGSIYSSVVLAIPGRAELASSEASFLNSANTSLSSLPFEILEPDTRLRIHQIVARVGICTE